MKYNFDWSITQKLRKEKQKELGRKYSRLIWAETLTRKQDNGNETWRYSVKRG